MRDSEFHPAVRNWFDSEFEAATPVQTQAWRMIGAGGDALISAPTGSGKTLAAFLSVIDDLLVRSLEHGIDDRTQVLYISPLKALSNDIEKNLKAPLEGIRRELAGMLLDDVPIRVNVRTGDTPQSERARMRRQPPHILVTTPESLYILLTSASGRQMLGSVRTVIVDEIHALAGNKRGAHLALSLARLEALLGERPQRIGVSATSRPIETIARFLTGTDRPPAGIVDEGHARESDLALTLPASPLSAVMETEVWAELYDQLTSLIATHRTTLVFVNTRRLAERVARHLAERVGEDLVTSHHGSLAKEHRLRAEQRLKAGELKAIVATASLELGIDIGDVDLVCQLGSPRAITAFLQRVGRSGHGIGRVPKGRLLPLSRDELVESLALLCSARSGALDAQTICDGPLDVLAQQIVAECAMREWQVVALFELFRTTLSYQRLDIDTFRKVVTMLADGFTTHRGRRSAHLHFDRVNDVLRGRRGARLTAITNGGAIPDQFDFDVLLLPAEIPIGSVNEDFAVESLPGDIFQLGNTSYRILKVGGGKVYVEDARGQPPSIPFWFGEAPGRSNELSAAVDAIRRQIDEALASEAPEALAERLATDLDLDSAAAGQVVDYLAAARAALGHLPTQNRLIFERFFDEAGDTHLVIHSPFGSRINRAFGLALRKCFCRRFNFELQAAALEDSIVLSLGAVHSFALEDVKRYLSSRSIERVLEQAVLGAPIFETHWRWNASIALGIRRFRNGRKTPAQLQRMDAEDLLSTVFPEQLACAENLPGGDREIPDHPLVTQTMLDCTRVAMDVEGLKTLLERIEAGGIEVVTAELTSPSPLAQEVLSARPFAFLDDAPAEERRTLAVQSRRFIDPSEAAGLGRLDASAIARVRDEAWPRITIAEELHDALLLMAYMTGTEASNENSSRSPDLTAMFATLESAGRVTRFTPPGGEALWVAAERLGEFRLAFPDGEQKPRLVDLPVSVADGDEALAEICRGRLEVLGPATVPQLADPLGLAATEVTAALARLEQRGVAMRGRYSDSDGEQWCERRLLARIHRYTLGRLRREIEPVPVADYQRFLFRWQGLGNDRREGIDALRAVLGELQGLAPPALAWEREILPARIAHYEPEFLDRLSASGEIVWWRPIPRGAAGGRVTSTVSSSPIALLPRPDLMHWRALADAVPETVELSSPAAAVRDALEEQGALFFFDLVAATGLLRVQVEDALGELVAAGIVTSDAFDGLRAVIAPQRDRPSFRGRRRGRRVKVSFDRAGRWAFMPAAPAAPRHEDAVEHAARTLLRRYGVVVRAVLAREPMLPRWRDLLQLFRRWEARGEIRGGRFVSALGGEQFALADAVETLRGTRRDRGGEETIVISAADPLNLPAMNGAGKRIAAIGANRIVYRDGIPVAAALGQRVEMLVGDITPERIRELLNRDRPRPSGTMRAQAVRIQS